MAETENAAPAAPETDKLPAKAPKKPKADKAPKAPKPTGISAALNEASAQLGAPLVAHIAQCCVDGQAAENTAMKAGKSGVQVADHAAVQRRRLEHAKVAQRHIAQALQHLDHVDLDL